MTTRPEPTEYASYYGKYISLVPEGDIVALLEEQLRGTTALLSSVSEEQAEYRYAPEKWTGGGTRLRYGTNLCLPSATDFP